MALTWPSLSDVLDAQRVIARHVFRTPLRRYPALDKLLGAEVWVKHENFQILGSFKVRGGVNLAARLPETELRLGIITASSGNHGLSVAFAAQTFGARAVIVVPEGANPGKVEAIEGLGARVIHHGSHFEESKAHAERLAAEEGYRYVHAANEPLLIAGVATYSLEVFEDLGGVDLIIVPLGAGSGACGACIVSRSVSPDTAVVAVPSTAAPAAYLSWKNGALVDAPMATDAEGLATSSAYELPQSILRSMLSNFVLVSEERISEAVVTYAEKTRTLVEGAGAASLAAAMDMRKQIKGKRVVLIASGGNISLTQLRTILGATAPVRKPPHLV